MRVFLFGPQNRDGNLLVQASKPSVTGLTGSGLKIREWRIGEHMVASRSLNQGEAMSRRRRVRWIDTEKHGWLYPLGYLG